MWTLLFIATLVLITFRMFVRHHEAICGQALRVPIVKAPGQTAIGRFGWKDQHASLLSFAADAYLNEMGITNPLQPDEVTTLCNTVSDPNDTPGADGLADIDRFARFVRFTKATPRDDTVAATSQAERCDPAASRRSQQGRAQIQ